MHAASALPSEQGLNRLALTADMIAVFARQQIKAEHLEVLARE